MAFRVKEMFYSLQGEGLHAGRAAVFCRFSGCNLWTGREEDRASAACRFCDTDFVGVDGPGGGVFADAASLASALLALFPRTQGRPCPPFVVLTGGEPGQQITPELVSALKTEGCEVAAETNGTLPLPPGLDWITVSPKAGTALAVTSGHELKLVWPQEGLDPAAFEGLDFTYRFLQPRAGEAADLAVRQALALCLARPAWRLSLQIHKILGIP